MWKLKHQWCIDYNRKSRETEKKAPKQKIEEFKIFLKVANYEQEK